MEFLVIGVVTALNLIIIKIKMDKKRYEDGIFDLLLLILITVVFSGTYGGLVVGTIGSMFISLYLFASPPKFFTGKNGLFYKAKENVFERHPDLKTKFDLYKDLKDKI